MGRRKMVDTCGIIHALWHNLCSSYLRIEFVFPALTTVLCSHLNRVAAYIYLIF